MNQLDLLIAKDKELERRIDALPTQRWATVTSTSPLRVRCDGDTTLLPAIDLVGALAINDRVRVQLNNGQLFATDRQGALNRLVGSGALITGSLNAVLIPGTYQFLTANVTTSNSHPVASGPAGMLTVTANGGYVTQRVTYANGVVTPTQEYVRFVTNGTFGAWYPIADVIPTAWYDIGPHLASPFVSYNDGGGYLGMRIRRIGSTVEMQGIINRPAGNGDLTGATQYNLLSSVLPAIYRPPNNVVFQTWPHAAVPNTSGPASTGTAHTHTYTGRGAGVFISPGGNMNLLSGDGNAILATNSAQFWSWTISWGV